MPVSKETKERIIQDAKAHVRGVYIHVSFEKDSDYEGETMDSYIDGATAEAERSAILIECLNSIKAIGHPDKKVINLINDAINQYNSPKIKE